MSTVTIVIQDPPYKEFNKAWHALRFAGAALAEDMDVQLHLLDEGVEVGRKGHQVPDGMANLEELLSELMECGLVVQACGMAIDSCEIDEASMIDGIKRGSMKNLANWVKNSNQVMMF